ncbi:MAG: hypothetical protein J5I98_24485 [Phaeodactylibacter sp.]|nr:hypothetical protein [Phaeodactylibacter sp.]
MRLLKILLFAFVASLPLANLLTLPYVGNKIQLPEIVFVFLLAAALAVGRREGKGFRLPLLQVDFALLALLGAYGLSALFSPAVSSWLEAAGIAYLILVYAVLNYILFHGFVPVATLLPALRVAGYLAAGSGIAGWLLTHLGFDTTLAWPKDALYPYFEGFGRANGFLYNPNNLLCFLGVCFFFETAVLIHQRRPLRGWDVVYLLVMLLAGILTFSKLIVLYFVGWLWMLYWLRVPSVHRFRRALLPASVLLVSFFYLATHVAVVDSASRSYRQLWEAGFILREPFANVGGYDLCWTNYSVNKYAGFWAGFDYLPFGLGAGQYVHHADEWIAAGYFPAYFPSYEPHSTFAGTWAELGLFGLLALVFFFFSVGKLVCRGLRQTTGHFGGYLCKGVKV